MTFKPVGVDENSNFPTRVVNKLKTLFPALDVNGKVADSALPNRLQDTALSSAYVPKWKINTTYLAGDAVLNPSGEVVTAKSGFTSGISFNSANWNTSSRIDRNDKVAAIRSRGALVIHLDDGILNQFDIARTAAAQYNARFTFAICADYVVTVGGTATRMSHSQIRQLSAEGHEIAVHSKTHANMTTQTASQRLAEWDTARDYIENTIGVGAGTTDTFVYPFSASNATMESEAYLRYGRTFGGLLAPYMTTQSERTLGLIHGRFAWVSNGSRHALFLNLIREAAATGQVLVGIAHSIDGSDGAQGVTTAEFTEALALAASLGMPITTSKEAFPAQNTVIDAGFEDLQLQFWDKNGANATNLIEVVADPPTTGLVGIRSLRLTGDGNSVPFVLSQHTIPITDGVEYTFSGRMRQEKSAAGTGGANTGAYLAVRQYDAYGTQVAQSIGTQVTTLGSTPWQPISVAFTPVIGARMAKLLVAQNLIVGTSFFDHLHFGPTRYGVLG